MSGRFPLSIIIPHKNDPLRLEGCVRALGAQVEDGDEIIVVDNGSDGWADVTAVGGRTGCSLLHCATGGSYAARNLGVTRARNDGLVFTDADCRPAAGFLAAYRAWFAEKRGEPAIAAGPVVLVPQQDNRFNAWECIDVVYGFPQAEMVRHAGSAMTANLAVTRRAIEQWGPFRADLFSGGDVEFSQRVSSRVAGGMGWVAEAVIMHPTRATRGEHVRRMRRTHEGLERLARSRSTRGASTAGIAGWRQELTRPSRRWQQIFALQEASLATKVCALACLVDLRLARLVYKLRLRRAEDLDALARQVN